MNFTALKNWGERAGLDPLGLVSQTAFLLAMGKGMSSPIYMTKEWMKRNECARGCN